MPWRAMGKNTNSALKLLTILIHDFSDQAGTDDAVYRFDGEHAEGNDVEAELDAQYMMGTAPRVKTEVWEVPSKDFCQDIFHWCAHSRSPHSPGTIARDVSRP